MLNDAYMEIAQKALSIVGIEYDKTESFDYLVQRVRYAMLLPASDTEWQIYIITQKIADILSSKGDTEVLQGLLGDLDFEVSFLPFD